MSRQAARERKEISTAGSEKTSGIDYDFTG